MTLVLRSARPGEEAGLLTLLREAGAVESATDDVQSLQGLLAFDPDAILVGETDGRLVGMLIAAWDGWRGNLYRLAVLPAYRRNGVARHLVTEGERRLVARGAQRLSALVVRDHDHAVGFWRSAGYVFDERAARFAKTLGAGSDDD